MNFRYVVVGGGTAGWLTALFVKKHLPYAEVTVVASSEIGILGAGEGTTPPFMSFLDAIDIDPKQIFVHCKGTRKRGIKFTNWNGDEKHYYHFFEDIKPQGDSALHFDANLLAKFLQDVGISRSINLIDDKVVDADQDTQGYITSINLEKHGKLECDFVFDCTGFRRFFVGNIYNSDWCSYNHMLPVNRAIPFFLDNTHEDQLPEYTESIALKYGWMWKIPVQGRYGCGYVFDSSKTTDAEAKSEIEKYLGHEIHSPRTFSFSAGSFDRTWIKNCIAIGLSSGFAEPLEATSIWVQTASLLTLLDKISGITMRNQESIDSYNHIVKNMNDKIVDFLYAHYLTHRDDSEFWANFRHNTKPESMMREFIEITKTREITMNDIDNIYTNLGHSVPGQLQTFRKHNWDSILHGIEFYR